MRHGDIGQRLVAAGIQRADDQRQAEGFGHGPVGFELLILIGRIGPVLEQELGSQQPDRFTAGLTVRPASGTQLILAATSTR